MSGVFLVVWDFTKDPVTRESKYDEILKNTKGGYPHITLFYSGKHINKDDLKHFSHDCFDDWVTDTEIYIVSAYVNSFQLGDGQDAKWRHDCLLKVDDTTAVRVKNYREDNVRSYFGEEISAKLSMHPPHITAGIHWTKKDAQEHVNSINGILAEKGPRAVKIIGITI